MYRQPSRKKQLIQRVTIYTIMSIAVLLLVAALLLIVQGYQLNQADGRFEQGGLVQFDSVPSSAQVEIDGTMLGSVTATKSTLAAGNHSFAMKRDQYKTWRKSVALAPGAVLWLNYARLVPQDIKQEKVATFATVSSSLVSQDNQLIAAMEDPATPLIHLVDISRKEIKQRQLTVPQGAYMVPSVGKTHAFQLVSWDASKRHLLVKHTYDDSQIEWLVVDTEDPNRTKNITALLNVPMTKVLFNVADSNVLYVQTGTDLRRVDIAGATISRPFVSNVAEFDIYDRSTIVFTSQLDPMSGQRTAGYYEDGAEKAHIIRSYKDNGQQALHVALGKYFNEPYIALQYGETVEILRGRLPQEEKETASMKLETTMVVPGGAQYVDIRTNGRFVVAQKDADYYVYDNELKRLTKTTLQGQSSPVSRLAWLDGYTLWSNRDGMLRLYEFDGANQNDIMPVSGSSMVALSQDEKYIYAFQTISGSAAQQLVRAQMVLD